MKEDIRPLVYRNQKTNYYITSDGVVYNKDFHKIKLVIGKKGYIRAPIVINGKTKGVYVHVAVWESFNGPIPPKMEVNHIKAIKSDNRLSQLELVTKQGNMDHAMRLGLIPKGEDCKQAKFTEKEIRKICKMLEKGMSQTEVAEKLNIPFYIVTGLANKKRWKHVVADYDIHNTGKHFYTISDDLMLLKLFTSGLSHKDIAKMMGLKTKSVVSRLQHLGFKKGFHRYTKAEEAEIMDLYNQGIPENEIADKFGVSLPSIIGKIHRLKHK